MDIGQQTIDTYKASLNRASTIFWSGAVGSVECAAFQQGTRDVAEACAEAAAERKALVAIAGRTATTWARRFAPDEDEDAESGVCLVDADGRNAFAHVLCGGPFAPCLDSTKTEPTDDERLLPAELAQKQREAAGASDEDEDDDDEGDRRAWVVFLRRRRGLPVPSRGSSHGSAGAGRCSRTRAGMCPSYKGGG